MIAKLIAELVLEPELDSLCFRSTRDGQLVISWRADRAGDGPLNSLTHRCDKTQESVRMGLLKMLEQVNEIDKG